MRVEHRRQIARLIVCAILDGHRAVRPLGHDLHGLAVASRNADPDQPEAEIVEHRLGELGDRAADPVSHDEARVGR